MTILKVRCWDVFNQDMTVTQGDTVADLCDHFEYIKKLIAGGNHVELMWATGRKDEDGVDIFGGDILDDKYKWVVKFKGDGWFGMVEKYPHNNCRLDKLIRNRRKAGKPISVIGNIHANPELLEAS